MKVFELIEQLYNCDPELEVVYGGIITPDDLCLFTSVETRNLSEPEYADGEFWRVEAFGEESKPYVVLELTEKCES